MIWVDLVGECILPYSIRNHFAVESTVRSLRSQTNLAHRSIRLRHQRPLHGRVYHILRFGLVKMHLRLLQWLHRGDEGCHRRDHGSFQQGQGPYYQSPHGWSGSFFRTHDRIYPTLRQSAFVSKTPLLRPLRRRQHRSLIKLSGRLGVLTRNSQEG